MLNAKFDVSPMGIGSLLLIWMVSSVRINRPVSSSNSKNCITRPPNKMNTSDRTFNAVIFQILKFNTIKMKPQRIIPRKNRCNPLDFLSTIGSLICVFIFANYYVFIVGELVQIKRGFRLIPIDLFLFKNTKINSVRRWECTN